MLLKAQVVTLNLFLNLKKVKTPKSTDFSAGSIDEWYQSPLGKKTFSAEKLSVNEIIPRLFGYHILQVGLEENQDLIEESPAGHKIMFAPAWHPGVRKAVTDSERLPLASDSIDAIVVYHALDFTDDSHELLREVTRVLRPGGQMLIIGFNPVSIWGIWRLFKRKKSLPWKGRFLSIRRLSDWLRLLNLHIDSISTCVHFLPFNINRVLNYAEITESFGHKLKSPFGGSYSIRCVKQVVPITPIVTRRRSIRSTASAFPVTENVRIKTH